MRLFGILALAILMLRAPAAFGAEQPKVEAECLSYDSAYENAPLFLVKPEVGQQRVYMYKQTQRCPKDSPCASRQKSFVVAGDVVFAGPPNNGFRCVYYGSAKGKIIAGFVPVENLALLNEDTELSPEFVIGKWNYESDSIQIKAGSGGSLSAEGAAYYQTSETVNEGSLSASASVVAGQQELVFKEGSDETSCVVKLHRRGPYLVASDNSNCGGLNVRFDGIYTKSKTK